MEGTTATIPTRWLLVLGAAATLLALAGCAGTPVASDAAQAQPGVTVYGTVDAGISRSKR